MKKFYSSLALAAAVCFSASAADVKVQRVETMAETSAMAAPQTVKASKKAPQKAIATTIDELCGRYKNAYHTNAQGGWEETSSDVVLIPGSEANTVKLVGLTRVGYLSNNPQGTGNYDQAPMIEGKVDFRAATIELPAKQSVGYFNFGTDGYIEVVMTHKVPNAEGKLVESSEPFVLDFYEDGTIESSNTDYYVAALPNYQDGKYSMTNGSILYCQMTPETIDMEGWEKATTATFIDEGYVLPLWSWNNGVPSIECDVYTNAAKPNVFRLYNPYGSINDFGADGYKLNDANVVGVIDIDATYPNCVTVPNQFNGEVMEDDGAFFSSNTEWTAFESGATVNEVVDIIGAANLSTYDSESRIALIKNCLVSFGSFKLLKLTEIYTWNDPTQAPPCTFTVQFNEFSTGIDKIVDTENIAPVEYYNLQGIRVNNPEKGVYIRVQGKDVKKVIR
ncbi:MAG: hypothetical protein NC339_01015 [Muribaculaceae bacterium]|nr:hypothetical protein [Muribaculaceae bacterium]